MSDTYHFDTFEQDLFDYAASRDFGELHIKVDNKTGLRAITAIHNTKFGPALGGCRCTEYLTSDAALRDVMRLARAMSYKSIHAGLPLGGGKTVIIKPEHIEDREAFFGALGKFVNGLNGRYITAVDIGTSNQDMDFVSKETKYVTSTTSMPGRPSIYTALGVFAGLKASVEYKLKKESLAGLHIAIQGVGKVGYHLAAECHAAGAALTVADVNNEAVQRCVEDFGANTVSTEEIFDLDCDVFAPCALGAVINEETIPRIKAPIIAGSANNQLKSEAEGLELHQRGVLYAPDYVINAGGLILAAAQYYKTPEEESKAQLANISRTLSEIYVRANRENAPTSQIADAMAQEKLRD